jgi:hypothetical protein
MLIAAIFGVTLWTVSATSTAEISTNIGPARVLCGASASGNQNGAFTASRFTSPHQMLVSPFDDSILFVADFNHVVRKADLNASTVSSWLGRGSATDAPGTGTSAGIKYPAGFVSDPNDVRFLFIAAFHGIRRVEIETAVMTVFSGIGEGYVEGSATLARFRQAQSMAVQSDTLSLIVTDWRNHLIRRVDSVTGFTAHVAGNGSGGLQDGTGWTASFDCPAGVAFFQHSASSTVVADHNNHCLRRVDVTSGNVTSLSPCGTAGLNDGPLSTALFNMPHTLTRPAWSTSVYLADGLNHRVRRIDLASRWVVTVVGTGTAGWAGAGQSIMASVNQPLTTAFGCRGGTLTMYVSGYHGILAVDMSNSSDSGTCRPTSINIGPVTLVAGSGATKGYEDGPASAARFDRPQTILLRKGSDTMLVVDQYNNAFRRINISSSTVDTLPLAWPSGVKDIAHAMHDPKDPDRILVLHLTGVVLVTSTSTTHIVPFSGGSTQGYAEGTAAVARFKRPYDLIARC